MVLIKVDDSLMKKLGATTASEFIQNVNALADAPPAVATIEASDNGPMLSALNGMRADVTALSQLVMENISSKPTTEEIARIATIAASKITAGAMAATGVNPAPIGAVNESPSGTAQIADNDLEGRWKADKNLRSEFMHDYKLFEVHERNALAGRIRTFTSNH